MRPDCRLRPQKARSFSKPNRPSPVKEHANKFKRNNKPPAEPAAYSAQASLLAVAVPPAPAMMGVIAVATVVPMMTPMQVARVLTRFETRQRNETALLRLVEALIERRSRVGD